MTLKKFKISLLTISALSLAFSFLWAPNIQARVSIGPITKDDSGFVSSFVYKMEAGQSISDKALVYNLDTADTSVNVGSKDALFNDEGVFTLKQGKESSMFNEWIKFEATTLALPAQTNLELPFTVTLPDDLEDGEYAGGLTISQIQDESAGVNVESQVASKVFILVGSDFRSSNKLENLQPIHPSRDDYEQLVSQYNLINKNLHLLVQGVNEGNVFANLEGKYEISMAGGIEESGEFRKSLFPGQNSTLVIPTETLLQPGQVQIKLTYKSTPTHLAYLPEGFSYDTSEKVLESQFEYLASDYYKGIESAEVRDALEPKEVITEKPFWQSLLLNLVAGIILSLSLVYGGLWGYKKYNQKQLKKASVEKKTNSEEIKK